MKHLKKYESYLEESSKIDINILKKYNIIGLDFDKTLIDNPNSKKIINFIKQNPDKTYYIITFRSHGMQDDIIQILWQRYGLKFPKNKILNVEDVVYELKNRGTKLIADYPNFGEYLTREYKEYKAITCLKYNIEVLVDDDYNNVYHNLIKNGIDYIDPYKII